MAKYRVLWSGLLLLLIVIGCSDGSPPAPMVNIDIEGRVDTGSGAGDSSDIQPGTDLLGEIGEDVIDADLLEACGPGHGCFLDPCEGPEDCLSGLCIGHLGGLVCSQACVEECPGGWECHQFVSGPDVMFICVSPFTHLCRPCHDGDDCVSPLGIEDVCVSYGAEGSFCGAACDEGDCPEGFACETVLSVSGAELQQCAPDEGICACTDQAVALALTTPCYLESELATCWGERVCTAEGLTDCDASVAAEEICDGVDNDCDGEVDEADCDDGDPCTHDSCDPDGCNYEALSGTLCDDGDACTLDDLCLDGACQGTPLDCDDGDPCTDDLCDPVEACQYAHNQVPCDDGEPCTVGDLCDAGVCQGTLIACDCAADIDCLPLENGDVCDGTLYCDLEGLPYQCKILPDSAIDCPAPEGVDAPCLEAVCDPVTGDCGFDAAIPQGTCSDGDVCTLGDLCVDGACEPGGPLACNDGNPCTDDSCASGIGCTFTPNQAACDDGNSCTTVDACVAGACVGSGALDCGDDNVCTEDWCEPGDGCVHQPNANPCDDGDVCTLVSLCGGGECLGGTALLDCADGNPCTDDLCDPEDGCQHAPNEDPCDDGDLCTEGDACASGLCTGAVTVDCDDDNPCTADWCAPAQGCQHMDVTVPCDDGNVCTLGDLCTGGLCGPGATALDCDDDDVCTDDSCDPETGCFHPFNTAACDDGDACTEDDACLEGACAGADVVCDDGNACTDDVCDPETGCSIAPSPDWCDDGSACTLVDTCIDGQCIGAGAPDCDDGDPCTTDSCDPAEVDGDPCVHEPADICCGDGVVEGDEECDLGPGNGEAGLDACTESCTRTSRYEHVLRMNSTGQVVAGNWEEAHDRVVAAQDCLVRFDGRIARPLHTEYEDALLRFDFQPLAAPWQNWWEAYAYVEMAHDDRAGVGARYRRGHAEHVWKKGPDQYGEAAWEPRQVDLYCERQPSYTLLSSFDGDGGVVEGAEWEQFHAALVEDGLECKVRFDGRVAPVPHVEHSPDTIYLDFQGLHAPYNHWDSYAFIVIQVGVRAALAAGYRRGHGEYVHLKDRDQHPQELVATTLPVDVYCRQVEPEVFVINAAGIFSQGDWETLHGLVADEARGCRVGFDSRIAAVRYVEFSEDHVQFEFEDLHAQYNSYEAQAHVYVSPGQSAALRTNYRVGLVGYIWNWSLNQATLAETMPTLVRVMCDPESSFHPALTVSSAGNSLEGDWADFHDHLADTDEAYECVLRRNGRHIGVPLIEYGSVDADTLFDFGTLAAQYGTWEVYAGARITWGVTAGILASYRSGDPNNVWKKDRDQAGIGYYQASELELICR